MDTSNNRDSRSDGGATTNIHVLAVDEMLVANSLLTAALLVGISITSPLLAGNSNNALISSCNADLDLARGLVVFEGLKHAINLINSKDQHEAMKAQIGLKIVKFGLIGSEVGTLVGGIFLLLSVVNVLLIKLCD